MSTPRAFTIPMMGVLSNSRPEVDCNVRGDDLSSNCSLEKPPNQGLLLTALRAAAEARGVARQARASDDAAPSCSSARGMRRRPPSYSSSPTIETSETPQRHRDRDQRDTATTTPASCADAARAPGTPRRVRRRRFAPPTVRGRAEAPGFRRALENLERRSSATYSNKINKLSSLLGPLCF